MLFPGQEGAGGPRQDALAVEGDRRVDHGAEPYGDEDLGDRNLEVEPGLPEDLEGDDDGSELEPRVAPVGQHHRDRPLPERQVWPARDGRLRSAQSREGRR